MEDLGDSEDLQDTELAAGAGPIATTTVATILTKTAWEQTILALQQLGVRQCEENDNLRMITKYFQVIVFVALLVGGGFVTMVWIELALGWVWEKVTDTLGTKKVKDPENPAALVGSFKRYK